MKIIKFLQKIKMSFLLFLETVQFVIHRVTGIKHKLMKALISNFIPIYNGRHLQNQKNLSFEFTLKNNL